MSRMSTTGAVDKNRKYNIINYTKKCNHEGYDKC